MEGVSYMHEFVIYRKNTNVMIVTAPHRYDLQNTSCINTEVQTINWKLHTIMKNKDNVRIFDQETIREDFTQHGLHLNVSGRNKIMKMMSLIISQLLEVKKKDPIILKWRNSHNDSCLITNGLKAKNEDHMATIRKENMKL